MKFYEYGKENDAVILLLPGTCCHWKLNFEEVIPLLHKIVSTGEYPKVLQGLVEKKRTPYRDKFMTMFGIGNGGLPFIKKESVYNQFYSDLITPLEKGISVSGTTIHCFYAKKMGAKYLDRYKISKVIECR